VKIVHIRRAFCLPKEYNTYNITMKDLEKWFDIYNTYYCYIFYFIL